MSILSQICQRNEISIPSAKLKKKKKAEDGF